MTQNHDNTVSRKGKHLTYSERCQIAILKKENYSNRQVADVLGCVPQTINNEIKRGTVTQLNRQKQNGKVYDYYHDVYDADAGQAAYEKNRLNCGRRPLWAETDAFIDWADVMMLLEKWSPEVVVGFARKHELFDPAIIPGTITLYQWIDRGIMKTKNMDLLEKLSRKPKSSRRGNRPNKRVLGKSIEERPEAVGTRKNFGHWEVDTVVGNKTKSDAVLLTLVERQTRFEVILKLAGKDAESVNQAVRQLRERAGAYFGQLFKTVTSDNGSEFAGLHDALQDVANVYFSHPYASWERGTSENKILRIQLWMNDYPRKILGYATPHDTFVQAFRQEQLAA